ncbi:NrdH-redoxin [Candidatus Daviesbacteria bacterium]|nr:NrdH-redoxin [Candidatus Daviesbacteria bacterium]
MFFISIKIYTTTTCPYCKLEKEYLDLKGIKYENIFVDQNPKAAEEMVNISGQMGVPFTVITDDAGKQITILGFDKEKVNQALNIP